MDNYKIEGTVISKQYGVKDAQDPKKQAVFLGITSTIMPVLLTKYLDFLAINSTELHAAVGITNLAVAETIVSYFQRYWFGDWVEIDQNTWNVFRFGTNADTQDIIAKLEDTNEESNSTDNTKQQTKTFVWLFIDKSELQKSAAASSSLESYLRQKDANKCNNDELRLPEKRVKIVEMIGKNRVIVNIIFENGKEDQCIVQLDDIVGYANEQTKKNLRKAQAFALPGDNYFETWFKNWQKPYFLPCGAEFKTMNEEESIEIPKNAFKN
ncbi:hypothetical protein C2G38_2200664 [Gigaspora rosea]|uniref:Uncharacterized protein n=1 Tax=Gigaspora rosea TaxID=44941 RepID=A0A397UQ64_9GLOM|nr:hypothetical protein C2G38_2200664 [Gigaspora rosea]